MRCSLVLGLTIVFLISIPVVASAGGPDWPNWRGPNYDGISQEKGFQTKWDQPPPKLWEQEIGAAFSGITCVAGKVYTCGTRDKQQVLFCFDADSGKIVWKTPIEKEYKDRQGGDGTRATPTFSDGRIYVLTPGGKLLCSDAATGKEVWSTQFKAKPQWGYSASVLIEGKLAIATAGGDDGGLLALDKETGKPVWKTDSAPISYSTPYPFDLDGQRCAACMLAKDTIVVNPKDGKQLWSTPWVTDYDINAATPIFSKGLLFLSSGYKTGSGAFKLTRQGDKLTGQPVWEKQPNKVILGKFQSAVLSDGNLYVGDEKAFKCVDLATGKEKWSERGMSNATVIIADGHLVVLTEGGELQIAKLSAEKYEPITKVPLLTGKCWTIPTLYNGRIYVRNLERIACYKLVP
jgi:outer membrane protein assembly factor BamB